MAAWPSGLGRALQRPVPQFDSGRRLQNEEGPAVWPGLLCTLVSFRGRSQRRAVLRNSVSRRSGWLLTSRSTLGTMTAAATTFGARVVHSVRHSLGKFSKLRIGLGLSHFT